VLDLEALDVMNNKMNTKIYTTSNHWSIIPYIQCGFCFIDLGGLKRRARNGGDYKLENVANVFLVFSFNRQLVNDPV
jgi:hypothetical protein